MPDALEDGSAVDFGGLVDFAVDADDGGNVDDGVVASPLPGVEHADDDGPGRGHGVEVDGLAAGTLDDVVDEARLIVEDREDEDADHDPGNEVGKQDDGLGDLLEVLLMDLRDEDSHDDRQNL